MRRVLRTMGLAVLAASPSLTLAAPPAAGGAPSAPRGEQLFTGAVPLRNGGPACAACHAIAPLPFPGGGSLGPDLSGAYDKFGPAGMEVALETLYFPAMQPVYAQHLLAPDERQDLAAFFQASSGAAREATPALALITAAGCALWLLIAGVVWRGRVRGVRRRLVHAAQGGGGELGEGHARPAAARVGGVLPEPLAARPRGAEHARGQLHGRLLLERLRQERDRHLGDAGGLAKKALCQDYFERSLALR